jgi:cell division protein ZapA
MSLGLKRRTEVKIYGERYIIKSDLDPEIIVRIAEYVDEKMSQIKQNAPIISTSKIAILAALNVAEELFQLRLQMEEMENVVERRNSELLKLLDESMSQ